jgi:hypothetical protein
VRLSAGAPVVGGEPLGARRCIRPAAFAAQDKKYPSYGLEPGLNFGMVF